MNSKTKKVNINSPFINVCRRVDCQSLAANILLAQKITEKENMPKQVSSIYLNRVVDTCTGRNKERLD